jgi:hypothetical protein
MQRRLEELDALRGVMLLWMTFTHLPTMLSRYVNQPFGFFAATEGFIFLSALFTGRIYFRIAEREGSGAMCRNLWKRAARLYWYQLLLLGLAFAVAAPLAAQGNRPAVHNLLDFYFAAGPARAFTDAAVMIYRPPLLDILPIYIIFLALTPFALMLGSRFGWKYALAGGATLWLLAQFGFRGLAYRFVTHTFGLQIPLNEMGAFNLWAWQLWWLIGLWQGVLWAKGDLRVQHCAKRITIPAAIVAVFFLAVRYAQLDGVVDFGKFGWLLDKWDFGPGRIIDFIAVAALAIRFQSVLQRLAIRPLVMLGQASLPVFCAHLLCVFFVLTVMGNNPVLSGWRAITVVLASISVLLLTARIAGARRANAEANRTVRLKAQTPYRARHEQDLATERAA